jgi:peptidoglycan/xylan/chitin deacetylase (PgdA/CDA1 family)
MKPIYSLFIIAALFGQLTQAAWAAPPAETPLVIRDKYGAIIRGDTSLAKLSLVFTGDKRGESTAPILDALRERKVKAAFFVTGNFVRNSRLRPLLERALAEGHYVGPHSDSHPLYCSWDDRDKSLVTKAFFTADLKKNIAWLEAIGALRGETPRLFIPPYEWYNRDQVRWCEPLGVTLINFTPGSGSNRDYAPEGDRAFVPSRRIYNDILAYEKRDPHGLNGFVLLLHLGSGRKDPFHPMLGPLCDELVRRGYAIVRVDDLLRSAERVPK